MATPKVSIHYVNQNAERISSSYWGSQLEEKGRFYLLWNKGEGMLLVPRSYEFEVKEMLTGHRVIVTAGRSPFVTSHDAVEILFDDDTNAPFFIAMKAIQCSQILPDYEDGLVFPFSIWTQAGLAGSFQGRYKIG